MMLTKQFTAKRDDTALHTAVREGKTELVIDIINGGGGGGGGGELKELLAEQNLSGETALYVAAENGDADMVKRLMKYYDVFLAKIKANNGFDAFHIAAKHGNLQVLEVLMEANPELSLTSDASNTTALHTAASLGHTETVQFPLGKHLDRAAIATTNGKTVLHSAARNGYLEIVKELLDKETGIITRVDKKGQTALHMAVKGQNAQLVNTLISSEPSLINATDTNGNTPLHIAIRKGRAEVPDYLLQIVKVLLGHDEISKVMINKSGETALDLAEKTRLVEIAAILQKNGFKNGKSIKPATLRRSESEIGHEVHTQLEQTNRRTRHVNKMHTEGLNNAINYTTVVAILIATVAFAAIFNVPGQFTDDPTNVPTDYSLGEARTGPRPEFLIFVVFDSFALFISLAVVVVQTSVVVIERKAKKQMMAVINKLMWLACVMISIAFLSLSYVVLGDKQKPLAIAITIVGALIMVSTLGTMCYWVIMNRIEASRSSPASMMSDPEIVDHKYNRKLYAV